jgi:glycosyltransferase involved in cell wall biosynthesis
MEISIIIPVYNRQDSIQRVLLKLRLQKNIGCQYEILIIDDGSIDQTNKAVQEIKKDWINNQIKYYYQTNMGSAAARNIGIRESRGKILLFLDSDIVPEDNLIEEHLIFHQEYQLYNYAVRGITRYPREIEHTAYPVEVIKRTKEKYKEIGWHEFISNNISIKKTFLLENGLFDESMKVFVDNELGFRLCKKGLKLFQNISAIGYHYHPLTITKYLESAESYGKQLAKWENKTPNLKNEILNTGDGYRYGFVHIRQPIKLIKYLLLIIVINKVSAKIFIYIGKMSEKVPKISFYFNSKAFRYVYLKAYRKEKRALKNKLHNK